MKCPLQAESPERNRYVCHTMKVKIYVQHQTPGSDCPVIESLDDCLRALRASLPASSFVCHGKVCVLEEYSAHKPNHGQESSNTERRDLQRRKYLNVNATTRSCDGVAINRCNSLGRPTESHMGDMLCEICQTRRCRNRDDQVQNFALRHAMHRSVRGIP